MSLLATCDPSDCPEQKRYHPHPHVPDRMDALVEQLSQRYELSDSYGNFICETLG